MLVAYGSTTSSRRCFEGDFPRMVLLGMTFLEHVSLQERNGILSLTREW